MQVVICFYYHKILKERYLGSYFYKKRAVFFQKKYAMARTVKNHNINQLHKYKHRHHTSMKQRHLVALRDFLISHNTNLIH